MLLAGCFILANGHRRDGGVTANAETAIESAHEGKVAVRSP